MNTFFFTLMNHYPLSSYLIKMLWNKQIQIRLSVFFACRTGKKENNFLTFLKKAHKNHLKLNSLNIEVLCFIKL